jgi:phage terminase large subunit-like protein
MIGIMACALGTDGNGYLLEDCTVKAGPATWGRVATMAYERHEANAIVGEVNFGGAMVEHVIQTARPHTPYIPVHASRGKHIRAEPISALYEQGRIRHVGYFPEAEEELADLTTVGYVGEGSPNRADAIVWGFSELFKGIVAPKDIKKFDRSAIRGDGSRWAN